MLLAAGAGGDKRLVGMLVGRELDRRNWVPGRMLVVDHLAKLDDVQVVVAYYYSRQEWNFQRKTDWKGFLNL